MIVTAAVWDDVYGMVLDREDVAVMPRHWGGFVVEVGKKAQAFALSHGFREGTPDFRDHGSTLLKDWLRAEGFIPWAEGTPLQFDLVPAGGQRFRLQRLN